LNLIFKILEFSFLNFATSIFTFGGPKSAPKFSEIFEFQFRFWVVIKDKQNLEKFPLQ